MLDILGLGRTHQGLVRSSNEDALVVEPDLGLYVICDGMGGHAAGDVAAGLASATILRDVDERRDLVTTVARHPSRVNELASLLNDALQEACRDVYHRATGDAALAGMGCTATAILFAGSKAVMAHVGDTRLYLVRSGRVHQLSSDHTMAAELLRQGVITADELPTHPRRHVLTKAIGVQAMVDVESLVIDVLAGDRFLLCSDGLSDYVPSEGWMVERLADPLEDVPDALIEFANDAGGHDNTTVIAIGVFSESDGDTASGHSPEVVLDVLGSSFLFGSLSLAQLSRTIERCDAKTYEAGTVLYGIGDVVDRVLIVISGQVSVSAPDGQTVLAGPGSHLGESLVLRPRPVRAKVTVDQQTRVVSLSRDDLVSLAAQRPWLGVSLLGRLTEHLSASVDRLTGNPDRLRLAPGDLL